MGAIVTIAKFVKDNRVGLVSATMSIAAAVTSKFIVDKMDDKHEVRKAAAKQATQESETDDAIVPDEIIESTSK